MATEMSTVAKLAASGEGLKISDFPEGTQEAMKLFDTDNSGDISIAELEQAGALYQKSLQEQKFWKKFSIISIGATLLVLCIMGFVMLAVIEATKESHVEGTAMRPAGDPSSIVHTDSLQSVNVPRYVDYPMEKMARLDRITVEIDSMHSELAVQSAVRVNEDTTLVYISPIYTHKNGQAKKVIAMAAHRCGAGKAYACAAGDNGEKLRYMDDSDLVQLFSAVPSLRRKLSDSVGGPVLRRLPEEGVGGTVK